MVEFGIKKSWYDQRGIIIGLSVIGLIVLMSLFSVSKIFTKEKDINPFNATENQLIAAVNETLHSAGYTGILSIGKIINDEGAEVAQVSMISGGKGQAGTVQQIGTAIGALNAAWPNVEYYIIGLIENTNACTFTIENDRVNKFKKGEITDLDLFNAIVPKCISFY